MPCFTTKSARPSPNRRVLRRVRDGAPGRTRRESWQPGGAGRLPARHPRSLVSRDQPLGRQSPAAAEPDRGVATAPRRSQIRRIFARSAHHLDRACGGVRAVDDLWHHRRLFRQPHALHDPRIRPAVRRHLFDPDHSVPAAVHIVLRPRAGVEDRTRRHHQLLPHRALDYRRLRQCRPHARHRGQIDGRVELSAVPLRARSRSPAGDPLRTAHGIHHRASRHHRQRGHRLAGRPRPSHRPARRGHGYGAHVRLHRLRRGDRRPAQRRRLVPRSPRQAQDMNALRQFLLRHGGVVRLGVVVLLLIAWEIAARWFIDPLFISPPSRVLLSLGSVWHTNGVPAALRLTLFELATAFTIAVVIGLTVGLAVGLQPFARRSLMPIILLLYGLPQITILPLFILYFGIGPASKIAFGVTHGMFPIMIAIVAGVQNLKPILLVSARSMGASRWQILRWVIFPHMIPSLFAGMRLGMSGALLGVLLAELYVSTAGIGHFTTMFTENFDPTKLFGLVAMLATMAIVLNEIVRRAETRFSRWR